MEQEKKELANPGEHYEVPDPTAGTEGQNYADREAEPEWEETVPERTIPSLPQLEGGWVMRAMFHLLNRFQLFVFSYTWFQVSVNGLTLCGTNKHVTRPLIDRAYACLMLQFGPKCTISVAFQDRLPVVV